MRRSHCSARGMEPHICKYSGLAVRCMPKGAADPLTPYWRSNRPAIVVDMGADTPAALAGAGAQPASVEVLLLSHLHADHASGVADFLWGEMVAERRQPLAIAGPDSNSDAFPALPAFLERLFGAHGAFPTLSGLLTGAPFALRVTTLPVSLPTPQPVLEHGGIAITALSVPHGPAPALAYRLEGPRVSIVFAGNQSGLHPRFANSPRAPMCSSCTPP